MTSRTFADQLPSAPLDRDWPGSADYVARAAVGRQILGEDPHRPHYHVTAPAGWMNDPNGVMHHNGTWHLFYQHNPRAGVHADMHWGYLSSLDLVHWTDHPCAILPTAGTYDEAGIWSGNAVIADDGTPTLFYTGVQSGPNGPHEHQLVSIATTHGNFSTFTKHPMNPVIPATPAGLGLVQYRDPFVWRSHTGAPARWLMAVGAGFPGIGGTALVYGSDDLRSWSYLHPMTIGDASVREPVWTGIMWECPDFFEVDGHGVLLVNAWDHGTQYTVAMTGSVDATGTRLEPRVTTAFDGGAFYAPQSHWDAYGRRVQWGWLRETRPRAAHLAAGWAGAMALPRILRVTRDGRVSGSPAPELRTLRRDAVALGAHARPAGSSRHVIDVHGDSLELELRFSVPASGRIGAWVRCSPDEAEATFVGYDATDRALVVDRHTSSLNRETDLHLTRTPLGLLAGTTATVRIFVDASIVEGFIEDATGSVANIADRIYPTRADAVGIAIQGATLIEGHVWRMASI